MATITTTDGIKIRTQTNSPYVVIVTSQYRDEPLTAYVEKRSASLDTLRTHLRRKGNYFGVDGSRTTRAIYSVLTGELVKQ